jgi:hypothetical protein
MATLLQFSRPVTQPAQAAETSRAARQSPAELIFFPGVRYERHAPEQPRERTREQRPRKRAPRDRLDLPE